MIDRASATGIGERSGDDAGDDRVLPFRLSRPDMFGRVVRLGPAADTILSRHDYPEPVSRVLGEALALVALVGSALKNNAKLTIQTRSDGPIRFLVVGFDPPGRLRGYASFDASRLADAESVNEGGVLGSGHLAFTVDFGADKPRQQGIVPLEGGTITEAALAYFRNSEQLPTHISLAVARHFTAGVNGAASRWHWRAGGLMVQHVPREGGSGQPRAAEPDDDLEEGLIGEDDDDWRRVALLAGTIEDHELIDPGLSSERLLYRLFHQEGVRVFDRLPIDVECRCSQERVLGFLKSFEAAELDDMRGDDGRIVVTCEFCTTSYRFEPGDLV